MGPKGWYRRAQLPHWDAECVSQFVTWRLADSIPPAQFEVWRREFAGLPPERTKRELYRAVEEWLESGQGSCILRDPVAASVVQDALLFYHGQHYDLHAWVVMPNHVHLLLTPFPGSSLGAFVGALKGFTSKEIHRRLGGSGTLWQADYFDRAIRDDQHFDRVARYIEWNPVRAKLCTDWQAWPFSSGNPDQAKRLTSLSE